MLAAGTTSRLITAMQNIARHGLADILKAAAGTQAATSFTGSGAGQDEGVAVALKAAVTAVTPVADFTGTPLSGAYTLSVAFTDSSTNTPTSWAWTFGDGGTSSSQNPSHSYTAAGTYTVALVATNAAGSNTKTRTGYVVVSAPVTAPVAAFSAAPLSGDRPLTVAFTDLSS
jgi:PKD repeat protein